MAPQFLGKARPAEAIRFSNLNYSTECYTVAIGSVNGKRPHLRIFKNKWFVRFAKREGIEDENLCEAIERAEKGLIDADLGGGVIKQRIARPNEGKSGGFRSIVLFRFGEKAFFVYGFPKSARDNVRKDELQGFKELAGELFEYDEAALASAVKAGALSEVNCDEKDEGPDLPE